MNEPDLRYDPICACCDEPTHARELVPSPFDGLRERWCVRCLRDWQEDVDQRMADWEDGEHIFI